MVSVVCMCGGREHVCGFIDGTEDLVFIFFGFSKAFRALFGELMVERLLCVFFVNVCVCVCF